MNWKSTWYILLGLALLAGCATVREESGTITPPKTLETSGDEVDLSCSYFYFLWGRYAELEGEFEAAREAYEKALICDPEADYIVRKMPVLLLRLGRPEEAVNWLNLYLAEYPEESGARLLLAKIYVRQNRMDEAARQYQVIHANDPAESTSQLLLAELYQSQKKLDAATDVLQTLLANKNDLYTGWLMQARIYRQQEKYQKARQAYDKALDLNWSTDVVLEMGELALKQDAIGEAVRLYRSGLKKDPSSEQLRIALVHAFLLNSQEDKALEELNSLKEMNEHPHRVDLTIARLYARQKKYAKSAAILRDILLEEEISEARYMLALLAFQEKDYEQVLIEAAKISPDTEEYEDALYLQVRAYRLMEKQDAAVRLMEKAVALEQSRTGEMFVLLAALYQRQGAEEKSRDALLRGIEIFPEDHDLLYEYGLFLDSSGNMAKALEIMEKVIGLDPQHAAALNYVGYSWADKAIHLEKALEYIERAVRLKPENGYILDSLGWVYFRLGRLEESRQALQEALALSDDDPAIYDHLGDVLLALGKEQEAANAYEKAVELFADDKEQQEKVQRKLRLLDKESK